VSDFNITSGFEEKSEFFAYFDAKNGEFLKFLKYVKNSVLNLKNCCSSQESPKN
jgi:hypothetical protein